MVRLDDGATDLTNGTSVWQSPFPDPVPTRLPGMGEVLHADVVIVGAGITGGFLAERFTREGRKVVLLDRRAPTSGSTSASTAMLLWELDASLLELEERFGLEKTSRIVRACRRMVGEIGGLVKRLRIACEYAGRHSLYMAGGLLDAEDLRQERKLRARVGVDGALLGPAELEARGLLADAALEHPGSAEADPVQLARGLLRASVARGALILSPAKAIAFGLTRNGVTVETHNAAAVHADVLVLANGYEMPDFVPAARHSLSSSWAIATPPLAFRPWHNGTLVWEAADPYLYMRFTSHNRLIIGGEDEAGDDPDNREKLAPQKARRLIAKAKAHCPSLEGIVADRIWSGAFGKTDDSLPLIGRIPGRENCLAAFGYGGNGITFSALAAEILSAELSGERHPDADLFALDRDM